MDITIAADRMVRIEGGTVECRLRLTPRKKGQAPPRAAFPWELSRARLKRFPVLLESDGHGKFTYVTIFKPMPSAAIGTGKKIEAYEIDRQAREPPSGRESSGIPALTMLEAPPSRCTNAPHPPTAR